MKPMSTEIPIKYDPEEDLSLPPMRVSDDEMALNQIPLHLRDVCAHMLIELKRCQRQEYFLPWKCKHEKHNYEACMAREIIRRTKVAMREEAQAKNASDP